MHTRQIPRLEPIKMITSQRKAVDFSTIAFWNRYLKLYFQYSHHNTSELVACLSLMTTAPNSDTLDDFELVIISALHMPGGLCSCAWRNSGPHKRCVLSICALLHIAATEAGHTSKSVPHHIPFRIYRHAFQTYNQLQSLPFDFSGYLLSTHDASIQTETQKYLVIAMLVERETANQTTLSFNF